MGKAEPAVRISAQDARRLAISAQRLDASRPRATRAGILGLIRQIGYVQLDPTNVVARNPYLVLWSRLGAYEPALLDSLVAKRALFETPSLIVPMSDFDIHGATMRIYRKATSPGGKTGPYRKGDNTGGGTWAPRVKAWLTKNPHVRRQVLARLRREGPLPLTAFEDRAVVSWTSGGWNDERNLTMLLAILQRRGEVVVAGRRRGQKLFAAADGWYDVTRPLNDSVLPHESTLRALRILQIATPKQLRWQYSFGRHVTPRALDALEREGEIVRVEIADGDRALRGTYYALPDVERRAREARDEWEGRTTLLSPFDNLIIDRERTHELFGYFYRMEIYVPQAKRKLGYWAMPVLHGDRIVGSVDPRVDREKRELVVNNVVLVPGAPRAVTRAIRTAVEELAEFVGAERIRWPR
ncbi:MAG TPA: crosslink repair DNA glycosylase YcaQ family protein [Candidatus Limnocylindria bacterium]|nr:crosslink repair DNA glycosylase YcaQ family protein [Candidatus Limnocylindria bacterium]